MYNSIIVDGVTYNLICDVKRTAIMKSSEISGMLLDKTYYNDVLGTYMEYTINMVVPVGMENTYASFYEVITNPVSYHTFVLPYNQGTISVIGRVTIVSDELLYTETRNNVNYKIWRKTSFRVIANNPSKVV